jgi:hypothetical protein
MQGGQAPADTNWILGTNTRLWTRFGTRPGINVGTNVGTNPWVSNRRRVASGIGGPVGDVGKPVEDGSLL